VAIDRPVDRDWYSLSGTRSADVMVVHAGIGCAGSRPLLVQLRNPEGHWMRTYAVPINQPSWDPIRITGPGFPSRYYIEVRAADYGCVGLQYKIELVTSGSASATFASDVVLCRIAHNKSVQVAARIGRLKRARSALRSPAARRRYMGYVKTKQRELKRARTRERRACTNVG
jgi:hypothetical protein